MSLIAPVCRTTCSVEKVYMCQQLLELTPTIAASISGCIRNKRNRAGCIIEAVVDVEAVGIATVKWQHVQRTKGQLKKLAERRFRKLRQGTS